MSDDETHYIENFIEIPSALKSFETGESMSHCIDCGTSLLENGPPYLIQKAFKESEVLVEFAHCFTCYEKLAQSYSKKTKSDLWNFFLDSCDFETRKKRLLADSPDRFDPWIEACITCGKSKDETPSYSLVGQCDGPHLLFYYMPYMVCEECQMSMHDLMSSKSSDIWDRWKEEHIGTPPTMENDFVPGRVMIV